MSSQQFSVTKLYPPRKPISGCQVKHPNTYNHLKHPKNVSFRPLTQDWSQCPETRINSLKRPRTSRGLEFSSRSSPLEESDSPSSSKFPLRGICMGRPYNSRFVEMSDLVNRPKVAKKPDYRRDSPHCLFCTDGPLDHSTPTFLDQILKGISYLDRSTNYPKSFNLPKLAASYLERAANSYLDHPDHSSPCSYFNSNTSMVPSAKRVNGLRHVDGSVNTSCSRQFRGQNFTPTLPQRLEKKLPELPLFANKIFSIGRLPKFWEAIRADWGAPLEPTSKPSRWW